MAAGTSTRAVSYDSRLYSVREVSDSVGISLPHVKRLIERGDIPFETVNGYQMVRGTDVNALADNVARSTAKFRERVSVSVSTLDILKSADEEIARLL